MAECRHWIVYCEGDLEGVCRFTAASGLKSTSANKGRLK